MSLRPLRPWESCAICPARRLGLCAQLAADDITALAEIKRNVRVVSAASFLYRQGEPCHDYIIVLAGWVMLRAVLEDGSKHILDFAVPGTFLGLHPIPGALSSHSAECLTSVTACLLARARFDHLVSRNITICSRLAQLAAAHEARAQDHLANIGGRDARGRVAHLMSELFFRVQRKFPPVAGDVISVPLSLEQIGQATSLTSVHVSRVLRRLREERVLSFRKPRLEILDPDALLKAAGFEGHLESWCEGSLPRSVFAERPIM
jgi:CRP-like cAMP-binding protein